MAKKKHCPKKRRKKQRVFHKETAIPVGATVTIDGADLGTKIVARRSRRGIRITGIPHIGVLHGKGSIVVQDYTRDSKGRAISSSTTMRRRGEAPSGSCTIKHSNTLDWGSDSSNSDYQFATPRVKMGIGIVDIGSIGVSRGNTHIVNIFQ